MITKHLKNSKEVHSNVPQLMFQMCMAQLNVVLWGRSTGKTEGPVADFSVQNIFAMPGANGFMLAQSYQKLIGFTLPPIIAAWEHRYGLKENKHFWKQTYAPDKLELPKAYRHPVEPKNYLPWYNGTGIYLLSQDRPGLSNGIRTQWGVVDEARYINKKKFDDEVFPTMTGMEAEFGKLWNYLSLLFCSDMPKDTKGKWLLEYKKFVDPDTIDSIINVHVELQKLTDQFIEASDSTKAKMRPKLLELYHTLNELKRETVYYSTANILDNIDAVGLQPLRNFKRSMSEIDFATSILNKEIYKIENGFYGLLNEDMHGYTMPDEDYIDQLDIDLRDAPVIDCRWEKDRDNNASLNIGCDYNNAINCVVTVQEFPDEVRLLSSLYVDDELLLRDCIKAWHNYYKHHGSREVLYWYDATAVGGDADSDVSFSDIWYNGLTDLGWEVQRMDIGQIGSHHSRHHFWKLLFSGKDERLPKFRYNTTTAKVWEVSAQQAGIIRIGEKVKKDKSSEKKDSGIPPHEATHMSEAADVVIWGMLRPRIGDESEFVDMMF